MRYPFLASAVSLLFGSAVAYADEAQYDPPETSTDKSTDQQSAQGQASSRVEDVDVFFATDSATLAEGASDDLEKLAHWAKCDSRNAIILEGHADPTGAKAHNLTLSGERAGAVRERLIDMGVPSKRIVVTVYGELGAPRDSLDQDRRVTARATETPVTPEDLSG